MVVNNVSCWAWKKPYMVIRMVDGEPWFYDAWENGEKAIKQALEEGGMVIPTELAQNPTFD